MEKPKYTFVDDTIIFGNPLENAVKQMQTVANSARFTAMMADHHQGYSMPIGGVAAYRGMVSPSGVGYDIGCGNKAVITNADTYFVTSSIADIMNDIFHELQFGVGGRNDFPIDHPTLWDDPAWDIEVAAELKEMAAYQLGTIGSGNHFVDLFVDENSRIWVGVHFGSRGLGHKLATHFVKAGGGKDGIFVEPVLLDVNSYLGQEYVACMNLAGKYAYAGRDIVCDWVAQSVLGAEVIGSVHNHHNFAWEEQHDGEDVWVVRKGATPLWPGQLAFIGGSMGDASYIVIGQDNVMSKMSLSSAPHGAGRILSRTKAKGKFKGRGENRRQVKPGEVTREMMEEWVGVEGVYLVGAGVDESPHCYKRLDEVLSYHSDYVKTLHTLHPIGVAMAE